jgi:hypothetical protein
MGGLMCDLKQLFGVPIARTVHLKSADDFLISSGSVILLKTVCLKLIATGEETAHLDTDNAFDTLKGVNPELLNVIIKMKQEQV